MLKSTLAAAAVALALITPAYAESEGPKCDVVTWEAMMVEINALTDAGKKDAATKEMELAKTNLEAQKLEDCGVNLANAQKIYK